MPVSAVFVSVVGLTFLVIAFWKQLKLSLFLLRFPSPIWARLSPLWLVQQCRNAHRSEAVMELHRKYGDFVQIAPNHLSINAPSAMAEVYGHKTGFTKSEFYDAFLQVQPVVFNARDVAVHARKRKYISAAFSAQALAEFEPYMTTEILTWKRKLFSMLDDSSAVLDMVTWTNFLAFDVIGSFAFGRSFKFVERGNDPWNLISTIDIRGEVLNALGCLPPAIRPWMKYYFADTFWSKGLRATANLERIGRDAYKQRKSSSEPRKDMLSYLFTAKDGATGESIHEDEIIAESISFIVGGSDTTSSTMTNFIDFVSRDDTLQDQLQATLDQAFPGELAEDWVPTEKEAVGIPLLSAVLRETMRVRPTSAVGLPRVVPSGGKQVAGQYIPEGTIVSVPTLGMMKDGRIFDYPDEFRPERWLGSNANELLKYYLPFSTGPRACIGRNFAWMEVLKTMALLFRLFRVKRTNPAPTNIREGFFMKAAECGVTITKRLMSKR